LTLELNYKTPREKIKNCIANIRKLEEVEVFVHNISITYILWTKGAIIFSWERCK